MFSWTNPNLVEGDILHNDSARKFSCFIPKPKHFSWKPPNNVIDNNFVFAMNKPFEIHMYSEYPGWLYIITSAYSVSFTLAMNVTFISNNVNYEPTNKERENKVIMESSKYKIISFPVSNINNDK
jgi:hypothetical protein